MADKAKHTLTFEGELPADEMDRAKVLGHPAVHEARDALLEAFKTAGAPHAHKHTIRKVMPNKGPKAKGNKVTPIQEPAAA